MGKILKLNGITITNPDAPSVLRYDAMESKGSLMLFDGASITSPFVGVPTRGEVIPNVFAENAKRLTGSTTDVDFIVNQKSVHPLFLVERTLKGGVHGIVTQAGAQDITIAADGSGGSLAFVMYGQSALGEYVRANQSNQFYVSIWTRITRLGKTSTANQSPFHFVNNQGVSATGNYYFFTHGGLFTPATPPTMIGRYSTYTQHDHDPLLTASMPYTRLTTGAFTGPVGSRPTAADRIALGVGTFGAWNNLNWNKGASRIIYRAYIEDLTVSGRTYAQVHALDKALYDAAFAPGGKFHGDTFTDPATIP